MLSLNQINDVCLADEGSTRCRYLSIDDDDRHYCVKRSARAGEIDQELEAFVKSTKKKGLDPNLENIPLGDNCAGYPILRHIHQGYDI